MKKKIVLLPVLLFTILTTSCNSKEEKKKKDMPEWLNHPHEVLRYAEDAWPKVKMSNHKLTCFDDELKIRDSIMAISYADFISKDETIEKSKEYVKYTLCYGDEINDVMADLIIYDNGSLFLNDCNDHHYYFNIALENVKVIFDTTEQELKKVEEQNINVKKQAEEDCTVAGYVKNCKAINATRDAENKLKYDIGKYGDDSFIKFSYVVDDNKGLVLDEIAKLELKKENTKHEKNPKYLSTPFMYGYRNCYYFNMYNYVSFSIMQLYKNYSDGNYYWCTVSYSLERSSGEAFFKKVSSIAKQRIDEWGNK